MSDELTREIERALADLEGHAPPAPALRDIRAGGPVTLTARPPRRWSNAAVLIAAAAVTVLVVGIAALVAANLGSSPTATDQASTTSTTTSPGDPVTPIVGTWMITSVTVDGSTTTIDAAAILEDGRRPPQVTVSAAGVEGWTGCNDFGSETFGVSDGRLELGERVITDAGCPEDAPDLLRVEDAVRGLLFSGDIEIDADASTNSMTWSTADTAIDFARTDPRSLAVLPSWPTSVGRLDCGTDSALTIDVPGEGLDAATVLELVAGVVSVEGDGVLGAEDPYAWGLDDSGTVVAAAAPGDIRPPVFHLSACGPDFGVRPGADLVGAVGTWVNDLGLAQTSPLIWGERFVELCNAPESQLRQLGVRFAGEDVSLRADGSLPSPDEAAATLEIIRSMTCQPLPTEGPTTEATSPTTTVGEACSAIGVDGPVATASFEGLPEPVAETRDRLIALARTCDLEALVALAQSSATSSFDDAIFWGAAQSVETLRAYDDQDGSLATMVAALTTLPWEAYEGQRIDPETGETVPDVYYSWPPRVQIPDGASLADLWDAGLLAAVAALNGWTSTELIAATDDFGAYAGFRIGIGSDGRWAFALSGD